MSEKIKYEVVTSGSGGGLYADGVRIAGSKPLGVGTVKHTFYGGKPSQWISVEDRLPEDQCGVYLGCWGNQVFQASFIQGKWFSNGHEMRMPTDISHWRPIELPTVKREYH